MQKCISPLPACSRPLTLLAGAILCAAITAYRAIAFPDAAAPATAKLIEVSGLGQLVGTNVSPCAVLVHCMPDSPICHVVAPIIIPLLPACFHLQRNLTFPAHVPGVQYWFTVLARNKAGFGPEVTPRTAFKPPTV